ncbi:ATP/GTP-binding protein [Streptomyces sp. W16]|uniref:ATP/GTP-binding protein n=1 Tax=Streptomyces sp. W16 TaxID=3076631 RepID=UPI00295B6EBD|nr:ATP/GTP-binding protein [Streptomyces sp. W16]MDV9171987.1 ATP/GTP-binding protein [Streptomyces sp. W16]
MDTNEVFTNRQAQWSALTSALAAHLAHVAAPGFNVEDLEAPRTNVLVLHGAGGIGKTTLSRRIESALASDKDRPPQWGEPAFREQVLPIRVDLARSAGMDFERVVLTIRLALTRLGRPLPAFDLALRHYWEQTHPGEPMEEYLRRRGFAANVGQALPQQLQSALADVAGMLLLPGTLGSVVGEVTRTLVRALREHRKTVRALAGCARLADLLEAEPDLDTLSYYPHLLAWELAQLPASARMVPVILLDTFEDIGDRIHRDFERLLQRLVWLMPNAFFVVTGRNRLQWADEALQGQVDFTGPTAWPNLVTPDALSARTYGARQVLIGDFTPEDCHDYLVRRLSRNGQPLVDAATRQVIASRSHGFPLFLDLAVLRFLEIRRVREPRPADFDVAFPALIARTVRDLTPNERHVLRSVALLDSFDIALATKAAGMPHEAAALRLIERPFVLEHLRGTSLWPYHLHAVISSAIRTADDQTDDRWSPRDWEQAAARAFETIGERWRTGATRDRLLLVGCLRQGLRLARDFHLDPGWLADAAWSYISDSVWEPLAPPTEPEPPATTLQTPADALVETLSALARRQYEHREHSVTRLTAVTDTGLLPADLHEMALYYRAKAERDLGRSTASHQIMQPIADGGGRLASAARRQLAHLARCVGDFPTALATARIVGWPGRYHRIEGDVLWVQGDMPRAAAAYEAHRTEAENFGYAGERAIAQAHRAWVLAFTDPAIADDELDLAQRLLTGYDERATTLTTQIAVLVRAAGTRGTDIENHAQRLRTQIDNVGIRAAQTSLELTLGFHYAVCGSLSQVEDVLARLQVLTRGGDYAYYIDLVSFMADLPLSYGHLNPPLWLDGETATRARWRSLVTARREWHNIT